MVKNAYHGPGRRLRGDLKALKAPKAKLDMIHDMATKKTIETFVVMSEELTRAR